MKQLMKREEMTVENLTDGITAFLTGILQAETYEDAVKCAEEIKWMVDMQAEYVLLVKNDASQAAQLLKATKEELDRVIDEKVALEEERDVLETAIANWHWALHPNLHPLMPEKIRDMVRKIREAARIEFEELDSESLYEEQVEGTAQALCELAGLDHRHMGAAMEVAEALMTRDSEILQDDERLRNFLAIVLENL